MSKPQLENLPDEILLKVLRNLEIKDLIRCSQLSKKVRRICHDEVLWERLNLCKKRIPTEFLQLILKNGCKYLSLQNANLVGALNLSSNSQLEYLELTSCKVNNALLSVKLSELIVFENSDCFKTFYRDVRGLSFYFSPRYLRNFLILKY